MKDKIIKHEDRFERWWEKYKLDWLYNYDWELEALSKRLAKAAFIAGATSLLPEKDEKDARTHK